MSDGCSTTTGVMWLANSCLSNVVIGMHLGTITIFTFSPFLTGESSVMTYIKTHSPAVLFFSKKNSLDACSRVSILLLYFLTASSNFSKSVIWKEETFGHNLWCCLCVFRLTSSLPSDISIAIRRSWWPTSWIFVVTAFLFTYLSFHSQINITRPRLWQHSLFVPQFKKKYTFAGMELKERSPKNHFLRF